MSQMSPLARRNMRTMALLAKAVPLPQARGLTPAARHLAAAAGIAPEDAGQFCERTFYAYSGAALIGDYRGPALLVAARNAENYLCIEASLLTEDGALAPVRHARLYWGTYDGVLAPVRRAEDDSVLHIARAPLRAARLAVKTRDGAGVAAGFALASMKRIRLAPQVRDVVLHFEPGDPFEARQAIVEALASPGRSVTHVRYGDALGGAEAAAC